MAEIERRVREIEPEMDRHQKKWNGSLEFWKLYVEGLKRYAMTRPDYLRSHLKRFAAQAEEGVNVTEKTQ